MFSDPRTDSFVNCALDAGVTGLPVCDPDDPCGDGDDYHPWSNADRFNYAPYNMLLTPSERLGVYGQVRYRWSDALQGYAKALFNTRESVNQAAPEPLWVGDFAESGSLMDEIAIHADNPYNPFGVTLGPGETFITRRPLESGPRVFEQEVDTRYLAAGLRGEFEYAERALFWDVNLVWSRSRAEQRKSGAHNARRMLRALGPPQDCTDPCVPLNFLGGQGDGSGTITAAALEWFGFAQRDSSEQELWDFSANLSGEIFDLPAGPLAFAAGFEHREHDGGFRPDPVVEAGDTAGLAAKPTSGDFEVDEFYLEIDLPLVSERPGAERLDLSAAVRFFDYSSFGSDTAGKLGLSWRPRGDLLLRGGVSQGFRAPNIGELFGGQARFDAPIADPCSDFLNSGVSRTTVENCVAAGVPDDGSYAQIGSQISVLTGGNPRLEPETADSYTLGLVYGPGWARDLAWVEDLSLAYRSPRLPFGRIGLSWRNTFLSDFTEILEDLGGGTIEKRSLEGRTENDRGKPEWKSTLSLLWTSGDWSASWTLRLIDEMRERCSDFLDGTPDSLANLGVCSDPDFDDNSLSTNRLGSSVYHDLRVGYRHPVPGGHLGFDLGVNNLFDRDPPASQSASLNGYDASTYDLPGGRFAYFRLSYELD
ncbi:MAG: TonB-dependent receptor [Proteobacteria bacterium]|nr:TonB-dependent receptor [Pseudomonadota bacterium]